MQVALVEHHARCYPLCFEAEVYNGWVTEAYLTVSYFFCSQSPYLVLLGIRLTRS